MTDEPNDAQIEAFRNAWEQANAKGLMGSRVKAGLTAVLRLPDTDVFDREQLDEKVPGDIIYDEHDRRWELTRCMFEARKPEDATRCWVSTSPHGQEHEGLHYSTEKLLELHTLRAPIRRIRDRQLLAQGWDEGFDEARAQDGGFDMIAVNTNPYRS